MGHDKLYELVSRVLGIPLDLINEDTSPDTIEKWDSLSHINLIIALEFQYGVHFRPEEAMELLSVKLIRMTLVERGIDTKVVGK